MSLITDTIYMNRVAPMLNKCTRKSQYLWNFRCPRCGDSKLKKSKKRGYVYRVNDNLIFHCHNEGITLPFGKFLKEFDKLLYDEYIFEQFRDKRPSRKEEVSPPKSVKIPVGTGINLPKISELVENHFAKQFLIKRKIPKEWFSEIYFSNNFGDFIQELLPDYQTESYNIINESRLVIPVRNEEKTLVGLQGRALLKSGVKYITIRVDEDARKIFGMDRVDTTKRVYVVEGPFDSMFLSNSVATMDSSIYKVSDLFKIATYITDNEPDNSQIKKIMRKIISLGLDIFIWPPELRNFKDINEAIISGYTSSQIMSIIDLNTHNGLRATLEMQKWEKGK